MRVRVYKRKGIMLMDMVKKKYLLEHRSGGPAETKVNTAVTHIRDVRVAHATETHTTGEQLQILQKQERALGR